MLRTGREKVVWGLGGCGSKPQRTRPRSPERHRSRLTPRVTPLLTRRRRRKVRSARWILRFIRRCRSCRDKPVRRRCTSSSPCSMDSSRSTDKRSTDRHSTDSKRSRVIRRRTRRCNNAGGRGLGRTRSLRTPRGWPGPQTARPSGVRLSRRRASVLRTWQERPISRGVEGRPVPLGR